MKDSFVSSITLSFTIGMFMMIAAFVVALFLREIPLRGRKLATADQPAAASVEVSEVASQPLSESIF